MTDHDRQDARDPETDATPGIEIIRRPVALDHIRTLAEGMFGELVKAVVDIRHGTMAIGGDLHADEEALLLDAGSDQVDLWGINLYPDQHRESGWSEFDSMINVRPRQGNRSRSVEDPEIRRRIVEIVDALVER
jgi:Protein of unknown function (DUF5674)